VTEDHEEPELDVRARRRAGELGFAISSAPGVGRLLAALAAAVPPNGRIIELGTGSGVGLAWLVHGLGARTDVTVTSVDTDARLLGAVRDDAWPQYVELVEGDGAAVVQARGPFDLIFADAPSGKVEGLEHTVAALAPGGVLVVDDMDPALHVDDGLLDAIGQVRKQLLSDASLTAVDVTWSSGVILATKCTTDG
jgi:demethylmenaquinone methyltransferase/2-methoxy-6-polyprenyl-1,4-benzoquinol methylase